MNPTAQQQEQAAAAVDSYNNRLRSDVDTQKDVPLNGQQYTVFGYRDDAITGFHATAYQNTDPPHNVIIAYRGTDPGLFSGNDKAGHAITTAQDIAVDAMMVRDSVNPQIPAADAFTQEMIDKAQKQGIPRDQITVAGHSLGGTVAEAEAAKFGLSGTTLNAFGAVGIVPGVSEGGTKVTNYVMAGDVVSAANHHYGQVVPLASPEDVSLAKAGRYLDAPAGSQPPNPFLAMSLSDHGGGHFVGSDSVLNADKFAQYEKNYADNKGGIDAYRNEVHRERGELAEALRQDQMHYGQTRLPPDIQRNLNEYLAVNADPAIQKSIEQNAKVTGTEHALQQGADAVRAGGQHVQSQDERVASAARTVGDTMMPFNPAAPLFGAALGEAAHLHGQAAHAAGDFAANQLQSTKHVIEQGAHNLTEGVQGTIHNPAIQGVAVKGVNTIVDAYHSAETAGRNIEQRYDDTKQAISHGIDATQRAATQAYDGTREAMVQGAHEAGQVARAAADAAAQKIHAAGQVAHEAIGAVSAKANEVSQSIHNTLAPASTNSHPSTAGHATQAPTPTHAPSDPRHPENPQHAQYEKLRDQVADAYGKHGLSLSHDQLERTTARVMLDAQAKHLNVKEVHLNPDPKTHQVGPNSPLIAFSGAAQDVTSRRSFTDVPQAQQMAPEHTFQQLGQLQHQQAQAAVQHTQAPQIQGPGMGGPGMGGPGGR